MKGLDGERLLVKVQGWLMGIAGGLLLGCRIRCWQVRVLPETLLDFKCMGAAGGLGRL